MKIIMLVLLVVCSCAYNSEARTSRSGYHNNHYQGKEYFSYKKNEWKRTNVGY